MYNIIQFFIFHTLIFMVAAIIIYDNFLYKPEHSYSYGSKKIELSQIMIVSALIGVLISLPLTIWFF